MGATTPFWDWAVRSAKIPNENVRCFVGEFFGTFILCLFAVGAGAQATLNGTGGTSDSYAIPTIGGCLGLMIAITLFGGVSGAHINPAVTLGLAIAGKVSWIKAPIYWFAQFFGGYLGAGLAYALYYDKFKKVCEIPGQEYKVEECMELYGIFSPQPRDEIGIPLLDQIIGTSFLVMVIMSAIDKRNMKVPTFFYGFLFALTIAGINFTFGLNAGGVLNPARDLSPRLMAISVGLRSRFIMTWFKIDADHTCIDPIGDPDSCTWVQYWVAPFFGTLIGGALGSIMYVLLIAAQLNDDDDGPRNSPPPPPGQQPSQYGYNGQQQPPRDWRNTEIRKLPPVNLGPGSPPPMPQMYSQGGGGQNNNNNQYY